MAGEVAPNFALSVARLHAELTAAGVPFVDMRRAQTLELQFAGAVDIGQRSSGRPAIGIEPLEGRIEARVVPPRARASGIRYFLDGAQRTLPVGRIGLAPVAVTIAAAAILRRDAAGACAVEPGTLRLEHAWLIPVSLGGPGMEPLLERIARAGMRVIDPLQSRAGDEADVDETAGADYGRLLELSYVAAREVRDRLEREAVERWRDDPARDADDGWLVVDGRLPVAGVERALGLVKQFADAHLAGPDAETLLSLPRGHRTTAFFPTDRRRGGDAPDARTLWYLRLWDAYQLDARHALIRIEASQSVRTTEEIDRISSWVLAERTPRATGDERWATLLYPIHLLERMLKRRIDADCHGWPGA